MEKTGQILVELNVSQDKSGLLYYTLHAEVASDQPKMEI
jgi:hypothetical protein